MRKQKGFSLSELLMVVAIVLIVVSIAIPYLLRSRIAANEAAAVAVVRTLNKVQISYNSRYPTAGYAATLDALGGTTCAPPNPTSACLIDQTLALAPHKMSGYTFTMTVSGASPISAYDVEASPTVPNQTGVRYFCSFADGVVRGSPTAITTCDRTVPPLQ
jgi:prepilin-type N-terminal cleavage/methylation domain-containing protein